eukprot:TRINITY_DN14595_c0_g1_i1.p1 TRINITY_DN14595_c0_g1~~TRINITY_DN14595_c0_g1_i1.p1  ORF type:complete len:332 (+),score=54.59 TRINITY_DN14595_c0_g1_i1:418-1413(+)
MASVAPGVSSAAVCLCRVLCSRATSTASTVPSQPAAAGLLSREIVGLLHKTQRHDRSYEDARRRLQSGSTWGRVTCSYSTGGEPASSFAPIDVEAEVKTRKILVLGGNGFVGSRVSRIATEQGIDVVSLNRSGRPSYTGPWVDQVSWVEGDAYNANWDELLSGISAVVSCIGGFGNNEHMEKVNGDTNIIAVDAASKAGISKFIYISVHKYNLPEFALNNGYFKGKRRTEEAILSKFPRTGVILQPGFIYGKRRVNNMEVPLDVVGEPLAKLLGRAERFLKPLSALPGSDLLLAPPVSVEEVAKAAVKAILDDTIFGLIDIAQIKVAAASL